VEDKDKLVLAMARPLVVEMEVETPVLQETMLQVMLVAQEVEPLILEIMITVVEVEMADQEEIKMFAQCKNLKL
jgi:tRNA U54 and U55 pseudouridine synthase Pus10